MAIAEMKKLKLIGLSSEKDKILNKLVATGGIELKPTEQISLTVKRADYKEREELLSKLSVVSSALDFLTVQLRLRKELAKRTKGDKYVPPKKPLFTVRDSVDVAAFENVSLSEEEILGWCNELLDYSARLAEIKSEENSLVSAEETLKLYSSFNGRFSDAKESARCVFSLGAIKNLKAGRLDGLREKYSAEILEFGSAVFVAALKSENKALMAELTAMGFAACPFKDDLTPAEKENKISARLSYLSAQRDEITVAAAKYVEKRAKIRLLHDNIKFALEKNVATEEFASTRSTFVMEGFVPVNAVDKVTKTVQGVTDCVELSFEDVTAEDNPPTLCANAALVSPFESITNMYAVPQYKEKDPNGFVAFFYFLFFGMMLSDAGYGLVLAVVGVLLIKLFKMEAGMKKLITVLTLGGVSTVLWGIFFGGWFALDESTIEGLTGLGWLGNVVKWLKSAQVIDPLDSSGMIYYLLLALALGLVQILVGMGIKASQYFREGKPVDAVFEVFSWYILLIGVGAVVLSLLLTLPSTVLYVGIGAVAIGLLMLMYNGARKVKGPTKVVKAFGSLYGIISFLSDVLSYSRLFGLGLASGVIGMVINMMIALFWNAIPVVGVALGIIVFLFGHTFNLLINLLGTYVHDARLQYIEFFSRFYEGGGHAFTPLGSKLKYTIITENQGGLN